MIALSEIRQDVADAFSISPSDICGDGLIRQHTMARRAYCKIASKLTDKTHKQIALGMGRTCASTAYHHINAPGFNGWDDEYEWARGNAARRFARADRALTFKSVRSA